MHRADIAPSGDPIPVPCLSTGPDLMDILKINLSYVRKMIFRIPQNFPWTELRIFIFYIKISFSIR
jgi:hypothetical protein